MGGLAHVGPSTAARPSWRQPPRHDTLRSMRRLLLLGFVVGCGSSTPRTPAPPEPTTGGVDPEPVNEPAGAGGDREEAPVPRIELTCSQANCAKPVMTPRLDGTTLVIELGPPVGDAHFAGGTKPVTFAIPPMACARDDGISCDITPGQEVPPQQATHMTLTTMMEDGVVTLKLKWALCNDRLCMIGRGNAIVRSP